MKEETSYRVEYRLPTWKSSLWKTVYNARVGKHAIVKSEDDAKREVVNARKRMKPYIVEFRIIKRVMTEEIIEA